MNSDLDKSQKSFPSETKAENTRYHYVQRASRLEPGLLSTWRGCGLPLSVGSTCVRELLLKIRGARNTVFRHAEAFAPLGGRSSPLELTKTPKGARTRVGSLAVEGSAKGALPVETSGVNRQSAAEQRALRGGEGEKGRPG